MRFATVPAMGLGFIKLGPAVALLFFSAVTVGCGDGDDGGGGDVDSGTGTVDGGVDAGPGDVDGGSDAGPGDMDAGPDETDAGADAGPAGETPGAAGDLVITELMAAPLGYGDDSEAEWIEIHNPSTTVTYDLLGCDIADREERLFTADAHTVASSVVIGPGEYVVLASNDDATALGFTPDYAYIPDPFGLSGGGENPALGCGTDTVIDVVNYEAAGFPAVVDGQALSLDPGSLDATANDTGTNWCNNASDVFHTEAGSDNHGTPGTDNPSCT